MKFECCKGPSDGTAGCITCTKCKHNYHYKCLYPMEKINVTAEFKKSWICPDCSSKQSKQPKHDDTPIKSSSRSQQTTDNVMRRRGETCALPPPCPPIPEHNITADIIRNIVASEVAKIKKEISSLVHQILSQELKPIKDEIANFKDTLSLFNLQFDNLTKRIEKVESDMKVHKSSSMDLSDLKASITKFEYSNNSSDQWSRRSNIEIYGIPEKKNENLFNILSTISDRAQYKINPSSDIDFITRVAPKKSDTKKIKPIIIRFLARYKKDAFLSQVRKTKLKASDIGYTSCDNTIYFNEHLTSSNKALLQRAKTIAKEKQYAYVWVKNCAIFARRNDTSPVISISNELDLNKFK